MSAPRNVALVGALALGLTVGMSGTVGLAAGLNQTSKPLTAYGTCVVTATPSTTTSVIDASVRQASPTSNFGTSTTNDVSTASTANRRLHIMFSLSGCSPAIPSSATVRRATLRMYVSTLPAACRTVDIFRVTSTWAEGTITWNNQPFGTTLNNPPTGSRTDSYDVGTPVGCENRVAGYITGADVTSDVAAFVAGSATNFGWMLRDDVEGSATTRTSIYSAKNLGTLSRTPQLIVTYVTTP